MEKIFLFLIVIGFSNAYSFDGKKCKDELFVPLTKKFGASPPTWLTITSLTPVSSSQYTSTYGPCSSTANSNEDDKKMFIAFNKDMLIRDVARGEGIYLTAYSNLAGCNIASQGRLEKNLKNNFIETFGNDLEKNYLEIYYKIERLISLDPVIFSGCKSNLSLNAS